MLDVIEDIAAYFDNGDEDEHAFSQEYIEMKELFRRCIVNDWKGSNFNCNVCGELNRMLVVKTVMLCKECWKYRNEHYYDEPKQRVRFANWCKNLTSKVEREGPPQMKLFV